MLGRFDEAWAVALPTAERLRELNGDDSADFALGEIAICAGDQEAAVHWFRRSCAAWEQRDQRALLSTYAPKLGRSLCELGRYDEAEPLADLGRELGDERDYVTQMYWRQVKALVLAHRGEHREAELLARESVAGRRRQRTGSATRATPTTTWRGSCAEAGRSDEAAEALEHSLDRYERKRNLAMVAQVKPKLEELRARVS